VTIILRLGGVEGSKKHVFETAKVLTEINPDYVDALPLTLVPSTPLYEQWERNVFHPISPSQSLDELRLIIENSNFTDCFFSSMHASNYLSIRGKLPQAKDRMLRGSSSIGQISFSLHAIYAVHSFMSRPANQISLQLLFGNCFKRMLG
jgi:hypothetical protein